MSIATHPKIALFDDPNGCADYIERNELNDFRDRNPYVVEILGDRFAAARMKDCWDREHEYFELTYDTGTRVLKANALDKRHLTLVVSNN